MYNKDTDALLDTLSKLAKHIATSGKAAELSKDQLRELTRAYVSLIDERNQLKNKYDEYYSIFNNMIDATVILNDEGSIEYANPAFKKMTGYDYKNDLVKVKEIVHPEDRELSATYFKILKDVGSYENYEGRLISKDGETIYVQVNSVGIFDTSGRLIGSRDIIRDITRQKLAEKRLHLQAKLDRALNEMAESLFTTNFTCLDNELDKALSTIGTFLQVDRAYIFSIDYQNEIVTNTHEWCARGVTPEIDNLQHLTFDELEFWVDTLSKGHRIQINDLSEIKATNPSLYNVLSSQSIKSILCVPMYFGGRVTGFMGFDDVHKKRKWSEMAISLLTKSAQILIAMIEYRKRIGLAEPQQP